MFIVSNTKTNKTIETNLLKEHISELESKENFSDSPKKSEKNFLPLHPLPSIPPFRQIIPFLFQAKVVFLLILIKNKIF